MESDGPRESVSKWMQIFESGSTLDNIAWCCGHTNLVNNDGHQGLHWFVCAFDCRVLLKCFIIWVWEPLSSIYLISLFLSALKKLCLTTKHWALAFQKGGQSCGFHSLHISPGFFFGCSPHPNGSRFC